MKFGQPLGGRVSSYRANVSLKFQLKSRYDTKKMDMVPFLRIPLMLCGRATTDATAPSREDMVADAPEKLKRL